MRREWVVGRGVIEMRINRLSFRSEDRSHLPNAYTGRMGLCGSKLSEADMAFRKAAVDRETTILRGLNLTQEDGLILFKVSERKE